MEKIKASGAAQHVIQASVFLPPSRINVHHGFNFTDGRAIPYSKYSKFFES
jgi:hypothetical protein